MHGNVLTPNFSWNTRNFVFTCLIVLSLDQLLLHHIGSIFTYCLFYYCVFLCYRTWNEKLKELFWAFLSPPLLMLCLAGSIRNAGESSKTNMRSVFPCVCFSRVTKLFSHQDMQNLIQKHFGISNRDDTAQWIFLAGDIYALENEKIVSVSCHNPSTFIQHLP